jgi:hypothetical protein
MEVHDLFRVVALRKGKLKSVEFKIREGEKGLSLFARTARPGPMEVLEAVRAIGKQGELALAIIPAGEIRKLGLSLVQTPGGTPLQEVNAIHFEARFPWRRKLLLLLRGIRPHDEFDARLSDKLCELARIWQGENQT